MKKWILALLCALLCPVAHAAPTAPSSRPVASATPPTKALPDGKVFIKLKRLHRLIRSRKRRAYNGVVLQKASYRGQLKKGWLLVSASLIVRRTTIKRRRGFAIGGRGGVIYDVKLQGKAHAPRRNASGVHWVQLPTTLEAITLTYQYGLQVPTARGQHKLMLDLPKSPQATLQLQFAGKGWEARTKPASLVTLKEQPTGTHATLQLPGEGRLLLTWKGKRIARKEKTRFRARVETLLTLQEGLLQGQSRLHLEVLTGAIRSVRFTVPRGVEMLHVGGAGVVEWFVHKQDKTERHYTVQLSRAIRKKQLLKLRFEQTRKSKEAVVFLPQVKVVTAEHAGLFVGVLAKADTEVSHERVSGGQQVDVRSLPNRIRRQSSRPILLAYRAAQPTPKIFVKMVRHPQLKVMNTVINKASFETVRTRVGREMVKATYWVTNNRRQFMPIGLPQGAAIIGAFVAGSPVQPALQKKGKVHLSTLGASPNHDQYLLPLIRSSRKQSKRTFTVELLYTQPRGKLQEWGLIYARLPITPIQILSYKWDYYLPKSHKQIWLTGSARSSLHGRFLRRLFRRMERDLREGTPVLWAGGAWRGKKRKLNVYNFKGLKERFATPAAADIAQRAPKRYKSRFAKAQWQVRAKMPLVGKRLTFRGHLVRNAAPNIRILYIKSSLTQQWFWIVLFLTLLGGLLFLTGLFGKGPVRWGRVVLALLLWGALFAAGYFIPMTYLAGFRGLLFGFWAAVLLGLATPTEDLKGGPGYVRIARIGAVGITFLMLLFGGINTQVTCLFLALPVYPALLRKRPQAEGGDA